MGLAGNQGNGQPKRLGQVAFVLDDRLSRDHTRILLRVVNLIRSQAQVELISTNSEDEVLKRLESVPYKMVFAPWYNYVKWKRVDSYFGPRRSSGSVFMGYVAQPTDFSEITTPPDFQRSLIFDFCKLTDQEILYHVVAAGIEESRSGHFSLHEPVKKNNLKVYVDVWKSDSTLGHRIDSIFKLPELKESPWVKRSLSIQLLLQAFYELIFPVQSAGGLADQISGQKSGQAVKAVLQIGISEAAFTLRLCASRFRITQLDWQKRLFSHISGPSSPEVVIRKNADFFKTLYVPDSTEAELVAALTLSAPQESNPNGIRTLWIDQLAPKFWKEPLIPDENILPEIYQMFPRPTNSGTASTPTLGSTNLSPSQLAELKSKMQKTQIQISQLSEEIRIRDVFIQELKTGGVGSVQKFDPPGVIELIDALEDRFKILQFQIADLEQEIGLGKFSEAELARAKTKLRDLRTLQAEALTSLVEMLKGLKGSRAAA